jgi:hypothetical protein
MKTNWNLDTLKRELAGRPEVKAWILTREHTHRRERYFMMDGASAIILDQDRDVSSESLEARIIVRLPNPARQGEITKKLFASMPLAPQLDSAIEAALQTDHQAWDLPSELPPKLAPLSTADPRMAEDIEAATGQLTDRIQASVAKKRSTEFN